MFGWRRVIGIVAMVAFTVMGCSQRNESSSSETTSTQTAPPVTTTTVPEDGAPEAPSWLATVRGHEADLQSAIENGRLSEVRRHTEALQATLERTGQEATGLSDSQRSVLQQLLSDEAAIAEDLRYAGAAGDTTRTKREFERLRATLRAIESQLGVAAR